MNTQTFAELQLANISYLVFAVIHIHGSSKNMIHEKQHLHDTTINYITLLSCGGFQLSHGGAKPSQNGLSKRYNFE